MNEISSKMENVEKINIIKPKLIYTLNELSFLVIEIIRSFAR